MAVLTHYAMLTYGRREAIPCKITAHHAYLSSSAIGDDSLLHTTMLYSQCGKFSLAKSVPSLNSILQSSPHIFLLSWTAAYFCPPAS